jgi:hypothetical protein
MVAKILQHDFPSIAKLAVMAVLQVLRYMLTPTVSFSYLIPLPPPLLAAASGPDVEAPPPVVAAPSHSPPIRH